MGFLSNMPVALITGIAGFTGDYVARELEFRGYQIIGLDRKQGVPPGAFPIVPGRTIYRCDLLDKASLSKIAETVHADVVVHLAGIAFVAHGDADAIYRTNIVGTRNLLEVLAGCMKKPSAVLLASSANVYGNTRADPIGENVLPQPANDYAVSKLAMEYMASLWRDRLPIVIARPFNYTGVGQDDRFLIPKIVGHFRCGAREIELGNLDVERDFSDVRMISAAYCGLLQNISSGETINVCSGNVYTLRQILGLMEEIAGYKINVKVNPAFVRANEVKTLRGCDIKLRSVVPVLPSISLRETLRWMFDAC